MNILALETASLACSAALTTASGVFSRYEEVPRSHTRLILPMVDSLLDETGLSVHDLDGIAYSQGPGAFTGVRVAVGVAQGLAYGADVPVVGVSTLQAIAQRSYREHGVTYAQVIVDARIQEVYVGEYQLDAQNIMQAMAEDTLCSPEDVMFNQSQRRNKSGRSLAGENINEISSSVTPVKQALVGSGLTEYKDRFVIDVSAYRVFPIIEPHAEDVAMVGAWLFARGQGKSAAEALPVYLRDKVTG